MHLKYPLGAHLTQMPPTIAIPIHRQELLKIVCCDRSSSSSSPSASSSSSSDKKIRFNFAGQSLGANRWKFNDIDANALQETLNSWVSKTQFFLNEVASPLVKTVHDRNPKLGNAFDTGNMIDVFMVEQTIDSRTPSGDLSLAAIVSIEQFSRMNGLTGQKMQRIFKAVVPYSVYNDARNLVEYCCFRFLSRDGSDIHPCLKDLTFRRLVFLTMIAWEHPYQVRENSQVVASEKDFFQRSLVGEEAFVRIAPAIPGVVDWSTAHYFFRALAGVEHGISYSTWSAYIDELLKVHEGRKSDQFQEGPQFSGERILCLGSSRKRPVLKWENNMAWPGKLTLTDRALYFEGIGLLGPREVLRLDLTRDGSRIEKAKVGPLGSDIFDSAVSVTSGTESQTWVLEFVDLGGEMRRDVWHAFINEIITLYKFIREFGPEDRDQSVFNVYGAQKGKTRATTYAMNSIARVQALHFIRKLLDEPTKLVPFSYLQHAPYGDVVYQTLAVNFWGGPLITKFTDGGSQSGPAVRSVEGGSESNNHVFDIDGSVYLRKWMRSPSWSSNASVSFWKNSSAKQGVVLSKNHVVADTTLVEKAAITCREKYTVVEKTQATIDAAMIEGIPSNIDLLKELVLPLTVTAKIFEKLRRWEEPLVTASFLASMYTIIFRNLLPYVFPTTLMILAAVMLLLKGLKEQGRLGRFFGKVTIKDQPPSNTIQKIVALKAAMREVEKYLQDLNVSLLKIRTVLLAGQPQISTEVALVLLLSSTILLIVPFKYILAFLLFDLFTRELKFRRQMVLRFMTLLKERWETIPAAPVIVLPFEGDESGATNQKKDFSNGSDLERTQINSKSK